MSSPVVLAILDGWGIAPKSPVNAATESQTPNLDELLATCPQGKLLCSGEAVGLPDGQQGNSEVGHLNLGSGRVVYQDLLRIERAIEDGSFIENKAFNDLINRLKENHGALHLIGLLSDGGVHSHQNHLFALLKLAQQKGLKDVYIHAFMDGRDVPPTSGKGYIENLQSYLNEIGIGKIASISGRYYAMDRDNRWERVKKAYEALVLGKGVKNIDPIKVMENSYSSDITDEFIIPTVISEGDDSLGKIQDGDGVIFFNFRADRAREITKALSHPDFNDFSRETFPKISMVTMTEYEAGMEKYLQIAYPPHKLSMTLGEYLASQGKRQVRIAETEKYAHVTFFFNGGIEEPNQNEERVLIPSPQVATYDLKPEMSADAVGDAVVEALNSGQYDFILVNFANPDMVGHTGILEAAKKAMAAVDFNIGKILKALSNVQGKMLICADHGNCEKMSDEEGNPFTSHTSNPVRLLLVGEENVKIDSGALCDVAPTVLDLMNLEKPDEMTGHSLIVK